MADSIPAQLSLESIRTDYSVFERDQVLTEAQLNSIAQYFDEQDRLTRVECSGVGIFGGLRAIVIGGKVVVGRGIGISTDGDLLMLQDDTTYDHIKPYDETAPHYDHFHTENGGSKMLTLHELVAEGESDVRKKPLATLPGKLSDYSVVFYMESYEQDHDLCSAADCDNLGVMSVHTPRMLLVRTMDVHKLLDEVMPSVRAASLQLTPVFAKRPLLSSSVKSAGDLAGLYRDACASIHDKLKDALPALESELPGLLIEQFGSSPMTEWLSLLDQHADTFANKGAATRNAGIQYYYGFLKDAAEAWNELLACLFENDSVLCPDFAGFPKHLVLGELNPIPGQMPVGRTGLHPSPLFNRHTRQRACALVTRLDAMIRSADFPLPSGNTSVRITPSRDERAALGMRAIPFYYVHKPASPILPAWNPDLSARNLHHQVNAYHWQNYTGPGKAANLPYTRQIGASDFFRIEGHLGHDLDKVLVQIRSEIEKQNLPIVVRAVLLHEERRWIKFRPPRYTDLHRFHHLMRKEVSLQLDAARDFSDKYRRAIEYSAGHDEIPRNYGNSTITKYANDQHDEIVDSIDNAIPALGKKRYSEYRQAAAAAGGAWHGHYDNAVKRIRDFRVGVGDRMRTDLSTPFDIIVNNRHGAWLDWLDKIIDKREDRDDGNLLLCNFFKLHPGIEHFAGVSRGGTFILGYDDSGKVVADFMLPYAMLDTADDEPADEPDLPKPKFVLPDIVGQGYKLPEFIDIHFDDKLKEFEEMLRPKWEEVINIQKGYQDFFINSLDTLGGILGKYNFTNVSYPGRDVAPETGSDLLDTILDGVREGQRQVENVIDILSRKDLTANERRRAEKVLEEIQVDLGRNINIATDYMVEAGIDVSSGKPGEAALAILTNATRTVTDEATRKNMTTGFNNTINDVAKTEADKNMVKNIMKIGGIKVG